MMLDAVIGNGCTHCEPGHPVETIQVGRGKHKVIITLCLECVMLWFPGKTVAWWEARHAPFKDHIAAALRKAAAKERQQNDAALALALAAAR